MLIPLNNRALLKLNGSDVQSFLQKQFSNDIDALKTGVVQMNAYCQHQGKIIALLWVMKQNKDYYLSLPNDLRDTIIQRLTMFKMMSDVVITDVSQDMTQLGVVDEEFADAFTLNQQQSVALVKDITDIKLGDNKVWEQACIENEVAEVTFETSEKFVPQLLNLDINEVGVNFTKGCYPGQEVVARLHYLGKAKRRLYQFECTDALHVGDELVVEGSKSIKASGVIVRSVKSGAKSLCLATIEVAHKDAKITLKHSVDTILTRRTHD